jgi:hypothetical protein
LLHSLIETYFLGVHGFWPLLHQPTFTKSISQGLHLINPEFGRTVLLVCAVASQSSNDSRVVNSGRSSSRGLAGWEWYNQAQGLEKNRPALQFNLFSLQSIFVSDWKCSQTTRFNGRLKWLSYLPYIRLMYLGRNTVGQLLASVCAWLKMRELIDGESRKPL